MWRLCRPQFRFMSDIASEASAVTNAMPAVQRIWESPMVGWRAFENAHPVSAR